MGLLYKDKRIIFLLSVLSVIYVVFVCYDVASKHFFAGRILKFAGVAVCFMIAAFTYPYSFRRDAKLLISGLLFTLVADALFLFASAFELGIACFCFVHLCYIRRYRRESFRRNFIMALAIIAFCAAGSLMRLKLPYIALLGFVYAVLIITSTGLAFRSNLPKINKRLVQAGMMLFLLCDINVAVSFFALKTGMIYIIASTLEWVFYIPSQALLSLSAVDYDFNAQASVSSSAAGDDLIRRKDLKTR